jgi:hypothetical protein
MVRKCIPRDKYFFIQYKISIYKTFFVLRMEEKNNFEPKNGNKIKRFNLFNSKNRVNTPADMPKGSLSKSSSTEIKEKPIHFLNSSVSNKLILFEKPSIEPKNFIRGKYLCVECGIRKTKLSELKQHLFTHANLRPFICYHCDISFKTKGNLVKHVKTKAHLNRCIEMGMNADDEQVMQVTENNIDTNLLNKQMLMDKSVVISTETSNHHIA